jgi:hypothetical protein
VLAEVQHDLFVLFIRGFTWQAAEIHTKYTLPLLPWGQHNLLSGCHGNITPIEMTAWRA